MANIISDNQQLTKTFIEFCEKFDRISFVTAWAGIHEVVDALLEYKDKVYHSVVGLQFYQTSPEFIKKFKDVPDVQYDKRQNTDVFHPKVYLFYSKDKSKWAAIVGSSNLTGGGFGRNVECNVMLSSDSDDILNFKSLSSLIYRSWKKSEPMGDDFTEYIEHAKASRQSLKAYKKPVNPTISDFEWDDYIERLIQNQDAGGIQSSSIQTRLALLSKSQELFAEHKLSDFPDDYSSAVAGLLAEYEGISDWRFFGSTRPNGKFASNFTTEYIDGISKALETIPMTGEVSKKQFNKFVAEFKKATNFNDPLTICTRFLAMKRPDVFVCAAGRSSKDGKPSTIQKLCELLNLKRKTLTIDNYWDTVILAIQSSPWYQTTEDEISDAQQKLIFKYRAAMLDALYYEA